MKKNRYPKKPLTDLPEGFEYSEEARQSLKERSELAGKELKRRCSKDAALKKRVDEILNFKMEDENA